MDRHAAIVHWSEIEDAPTSYSRDQNDPMALDANFRHHFGLSRIGVHHQRLPAGMRLSYPHAESAEEEFVYVVEGMPDVWLDGTLHRLRPGDGVGFPAGVGLAHTFINNTSDDVRLLVVGETTKPENKVYYPLNPELREQVGYWWEDAPQRPLGPHNGLPDDRGSNSE